MYLRFVETLTANIFILQTVLCENQRQFNKVSLLLTGVKKTLMSCPLSIFLGNLGFEQPLGDLHVQL